jgi:hypothetical protein
MIALPYVRNYENKGERRKRIRIEGKNKEGKEGQSREFGFKKFLEFLPRIEREAKKGMPEVIFEESKVKKGERKRKAYKTMLDPQLSSVRSLSKIQEADFFPISVKNISPAPCYSPDFFASPPRFKVRQYSSIYFKNKH